MKKMRLDTEALRVQSFAVAEVQTRAGTVWGHDDDGTIRDSCGGRTCDTVICVCVVSQDRSACASSCC